MPKKTVFEFELGDSVVFVDNPNITATILGRAEHVNAGPQYRLRYADGSDSVVEAWWDEDALEAAPEKDEKPSKKSSKDDDDDEEEKPSKKSSKKSKDADEDDDD